MRRNPILFLVVILMLAALACNVGPFGSDEATEVPATQEASSEPVDTPEPPPTQAPADTPTPAPSPTPEPRSADEVMEVASMAMDSADSFRFFIDMQMELGGEGMAFEIPMTFEGVMQSPDMTAGTLTISFLGIEMESEIITVGDTTYMTDIESGEWGISTDGGFLGEFGGEFTSPDVLFGAEGSDFSDLEVVGEESFNGIPVVHLQGSMAMDDFEGGDLSVDIWVGSEDNYIHQIVIEGQTVIDATDDALFGAGGGDLSMLITMNMSEFNEPVDIQIPDIDTDSVVVDDDPIFFANPIHSVAFLPGGDILATGGNDGSIYLWDLENPGVEMFSLPGHTDWIRSVASSADGSWLASGSDDTTVQVWSSDSFSSPHATLEEHEDWVRAVSFSPDSQLLASGSDDYTVRLWDTNDFSAAPTVLETNAFVLTVAFSPDGTALAAGGGEGDVYLWDLNDLSAPPRILEGHTDWVRSVDFSPDGMYMASGSDDLTVLLWDLANLDADPISLEGHTDWVKSVAFSTDGSFLASGSDDMTILVWEMADLNAVPITLVGHTNYVSSVAFNPFDDSIASGSEDGTARLWSADTPGDFIIFGTE